METKSVLLHKTNTGIASEFSAFVGVVTNKSGIPLRSRMRVSFLLNKFM